MNKLIDKTAIITGAGKGIGRTSAELFLSEGSKVALVSRTKSDLDEFSRIHRNQKQKFICLAADISNEKSVKSIVRKTVKTFGTVDILINNAGLGRFANLVDSKTRDFDDMFNTNVRGLYFMTRECLPQMIKQNSGTIINISSMAGKQGFATGAIYCATKHAVMGLSRALLLEVRKYNIRVIAICPGSVDTEFFRKESHTALAWSHETVLKPKDVAETCLLAATLPQSAMLSELDIRPTNPTY